MSAPTPADGPNVVFAAGGTGGHIYPALAVAEALREADPSIAIRFLCSDRAIDARVLGPTGEDFTPTHAHPFGVRPRALLRFVWGWGRSLREARAVVRGAEALVVTGGFVSAPAARAARLEGVPIVLLNLDAIPGKASRLVARTADVSLTASASDVTPKEWERIAPVVRAALLEYHDQHAARAHFDLDADTPTLLVTGGSQGARSLNDAVRALLDEHADALTGWQVLHQCGSDEDMRTQLSDAYERAEIRAAVTPFVDRMDLAWHAADFAISRAGAGAVGEAWATRTPTLFLPYPYHADDHQVHNAAPLVQAGAARTITDHAGPETLHELVPNVRPLCTVGAQREAMRGAFDALGPANGARHAASHIMSLIERDRDA